MRSFFVISFSLGVGLACGVALYAQSSSAPPANPPAGSQPDRPIQQNTQNPFPEDTSSVPVIPAHDTADLPPASGKDAIPMPPDDVDPVRSPEQAGVAAEGSESSSSSSLNGLGNLLPGPDDDAAASRHGKNGAGEVVEHQETAKEDEDVGAYYLDKKNWKAALSRFQSALVLDPDNPDVYWGLAECQRHLGDLATARANYQKVVDYDPDSHHGKDAKKLLKDPELANARPSASSASVPVAPQ